MDEDNKPSGLDMWTQCDDENKRLRAVNAELMDALHIISRSTMDPFICGTAIEAIRKARG